MTTEYDNTDTRSLSKASLKEIQEKRLRAQVRRVYQNSKFYHQLMERAGVSPEDIRTVEDMRKLPFTTKEDLRNFGYPYGGDFLTVSLSEIVGWHMTSGTTGKPTVGAYTKDDIDLWADLVARSLRTAGVTRDDIVMNVYGYGLFTGGIGLHIGAQRLGAKVIPWSTGRTDAMVKIMKDFRATVVTGTPSYELLIGEKALEINIDPKKDLDLRLAIPGAESMTPEMLHRIEEVLGLKARGGGAREIYGLTEAIGPGMAQECPEDEHRRMHVWTDHFLVEVIDPETGEGVGEGEVGELVFTHLTREGMPLLRYRTRDLTVLRESEDYIPFPTIDMIKGRSDDVVFYKGVKIYPTAINEVLMSHREVREYQVIIIRDPATFVIKVETETPSQELRTKLVEEVRGAVFATPQVEFVPVGSLPRFEGKSKRVIVT